MTHHLTTSEPDWCAALVPRVYFDRVVYDADALAPVAQALSMVALGAVAWVTTPAALRRENDFTWGPMAEVATIFAGIFATMMPALVVRLVACLTV